MNVTCFGSCRTLPINKYATHSRLNELTTFTHTTKEVIQLIKFINDEITIPDHINKYCFRTGITTNSNIYSNENIKNTFLNSDAIIIEICSNKLYMYENYYLHHLSVDRRFPEHKITPENIIKNTVYTIQTNESIEEDLIYLAKLFEHKKLLIISHYNVRHNGVVFKTREELINTVSRLCQKHNILFCDPSIIFNQHRQEDIIGNDYGHLTEHGQQLIGKILYDKITT